MIYVILTIGKTGSSLIAKTLHESGIYMGLLEGLGKKLHEDTNFKYINRCLYNKILSKDKLYNKAIKLIINYSITYNNWGFKDPRTMFFYDSFWNKVLPCHRLIIVCRNLQDVFLHYCHQWRGSRPQPIEINQIKIDINNLWKQLCTECLKHIGQVELVIIDYDDFMYGNDLKILEDFVEKKLVDVRDTNRHHHKSKKDRKYMDMLNTLKRKVDYESLIHAYA